VIDVGCAGIYGSTCAYRDAEELLVESGVEVDHVTVYRRGAAVHPAVGRRGPVARHWPGDGWFVDETYLKVNGVRWVDLRDRPW
jgi:transposase, IS6 family